MPPKKMYDTTINVAVTQDTKTRAEALAKAQGRLPADVVRAALAAYLRKEEGRRK